MGVRATARCLLVAITICSWIAISNHCTFRAIAAKGQTNQSGCPFHSQPAKPAPKSPATECCKVLRAIAKTPAKNPAPAIVDLAHVDLLFAEVAALAPPKIFLILPTLDTGPPGTTSFAELSESMRANAPPFFV